MASKKSRNRTWYRQCFVDHPLYDADNTGSCPDEVWTNADGEKDKVKVMCERCLNALIISRQTEDDNAGRPRKPAAVYTLECK
jgi:hypothetical protein